MRRGWGGEKWDRDKGKRLITRSQSSDSKVQLRDLSGYHGSSQGLLAHPSTIFHHTAPSTPRDGIWDTSRAAPSAGVPSPQWGSCGQGQELCSWVKGTQNQWWAAEGIKHFQLHGRVGWWLRSSLSTPRFLN